MAASGTQANSYSFPRVAGLGSMGKDAAAQLSKACALLRDARATDAADRIAAIDQHVGRAEYSALEKLADPELAADELYASGQRPVRRAHTWRNATALIPLLITWVALGLASVEYRNELAKHPGDATKPFLLLWEEGFGDRFPSFAEVALLDFGILFIVLLMTWWVHHVEGHAAVLRNDVIDRLYAAMNALEAAIDQGTIRLPASAEEWASAANRIITGAMEETRLLARTGHEAIAQATGALAGIQQQGSEFIEKFSTDIRETLAAVRDDNEQFIVRTAKEATETLQRLVEQQMDPLLNQLRTMLTEFGRHQETYRTGVADLAQGVTSIKGSAQELVDSAQAYNKIADSITRNLETIATSQQKFTSQVSGSVESMKTAAKAMSEVRDVFQDMRDGMRQMADNITGASRNLESAQRSLADTSSALSDSTSAFNKATRELRSAAAALHASSTGRTSRWRRLFGR